MLNPQYGSQARMNHIELNGKSRVNISNLEMVNAHDDPVLLAGYSNGGVVGTVLHKMLKITIFGHKN